MASFQDQLKKSRSIQPKRLKNDLFKYIRSIERELINRNKKQIEDDSSDIFGKPIGFYSEATDLITGGRKKKGDPYTGVDTGDWFKGFYMQEVAGVVTFRSSDPKNADILYGDNNWLSDELFGLTDENLWEVIETKLLPFFIQNAREKLGI